MTLLPRPHLDQEIPCSIGLRLPWRTGGDDQAIVRVELLIAPTLSVNISFRFADGIEKVGGPDIDAGVTDIVRRWISRNRDVLLAVAGGEYDLARRILDIDLEDSQILISELTRLSLPASDPVVAEAIARNQAQKRNPAASTPGDLRREMQRRSMIANHRRRRVLGGSGSVPGVVY